MDKYELLKSRLKNREVILAENWMFTDSTVMVEAANIENVDFILFDGEHGVFNNEKLIPYLQICRLMKFPAIVRVPVCEYTFVARALDLGADGVMLPRVESMAQLKAGVDGMFFPPIGKTGNGGHGQFKINESFEEYQQNRFLFIQIESQKGIDLIPEMVEAYGEQIAGFIIGPYDLSISMGINRQFDNKIFLSEIQRTFDICKKCDKSVGIYCDDEEIAVKYHNMGANILWVSSDYKMFLRGLTETFEPLYKLRNK